MAQSPTSFLVTRPLTILVEGGGFEPPKAEPSDLQSDPFGHSGTPPYKTKLRILVEQPAAVNRNPPEIHHLFRDQGLSGSAGEAA